MNIEKYKKYFPDDQGLEILNKYNNYINVHNQVFSDDDDNFVCIQCDRMDLQDVLDIDPSLFTSEEITKLKETDLYVLSNLHSFHKLIQHYSGSTKYWWYNLHEINSGTIPLPNIEEIFYKYIKS